MKRFAFGIIGLSCLAVQAETYLPGEGDIAVSVYQTTGERGFREIPTTPFTVHSYTNRPPMVVDTAEDRGIYSGLGVSLTDASAWVLSRIAPDKRKALLEAVFSEEKGAGLHGVRLNIGSSDYSTAIYCYNDTPGDVEMKNFLLARDDHWIVPMATGFDADECKTLLFKNPGEEYVLVVVSDGKGAPGGAPNRQKADGSEPRPKLYVKYAGEMKHLPLPYGTWSVTTMVFKKK